jgi:hypothetical protein
LVRALFHCRPMLVVLSLALLIVAQPMAGQETENRAELGHPGYLILSAARDSSAGYAWEEGPGPGQIRLRWEGGHLTIPDTLVLEPFAQYDLAVPVRASLEGEGDSGKLSWRDGRYEVSEPLFLDDGQVRVLLRSGELEILGTRLRYQPAEAEIKGENVDLRSSFLMLSGLLLLIWVLMRRARKKLKENL